MSKFKSEFEEFDKVMGRLLSVPYSELQQKLEEEKKAKEEKKGRRAISPSAAPSSSSRKKVAG